MAKKKEAAAAVDIDNLSPEEMKELLKKQMEENSKLTSENKKLVKESKAQAPVEFEVDDDPEHDIEGGTYEFTAPALTWEDNSVVNIRELAESKDEKDQKKYQLICAKLVLIKSGLVRRKEG